MRTNRYRGFCRYCGNTVRPRGGVLFNDGGRYSVAHLACSETSSPRVVTVRAGSWTGTQNVRGRCEDAPCCGCCTF